MNGFFTLFIILAFVDLAAHRPSLKPWAVTGRSLFFTLLYVLAIVGCLVIVFYNSALRFNFGSAAADSAAARVTTPLPAPDYCARYGLTQREAEVLDCILSGQSIAEISEALFISQRTVKFHITKLLRKTGTTSQIRKGNCSCCCTKSRENKL